MTEVTWTDDLVDLFGHWLTSSSLIHRLAVNLPSRPQCTSLTSHCWIVHAYLSVKGYTFRSGIFTRCHFQIRAYWGQLHHKSVSCCHPSCICLHGQPHASYVYSTQELVMAGQAKELPYRHQKEHSSNLPNFPPWSWLTRWEFQSSNHRWK